jgi:hypothetical protein
LTEQTFALKIAIIRARGSWLIEAVFVFVCFTTIPKLGKESMQTQTISLSSEIDAYIQQSGFPLSRWYAGVTSDIEGRLFGYHKATRPHGWWIFRRCLNATEARELEAAYHRAGCKGAGGGGDDDAVYIYAYVITPSTVE